jgi:hypothetical protein
MRTQIVYLVVRADGDIRVAKRPRLSTDEVAVAISLRFPDGWGRTVAHIDVDMPEPPSAELADEEQGAES